jgi:hypothetical protein
MRVLKEGATGDDVLAWELFLRGQSYYWVEADGNFDPEAVQATRLWQKDQGIDVDGEVGPGTLAKAKLSGFSLGGEEDEKAADETDESGPAWPPKPEFSPLSYQQRVQIFGQFPFEPAPVPGNPEAIRVLDDWVKKNIVAVDIPVLDRLDKKPGDDRYQFHVRCVDQIRDFFQAVDDAALADRILTFDGSLNLRFIRGSRTILSNHAQGAAFDINAEWNGLNCVPALKGQKGSIRELVPIMHAHGIYSGMHFKGRCDGMHGEAAEVK